MSAAAGLPIHELAQRCAQETENFARRRPSDDQFCFELLRRALQEGSPDAFTRVYQIYERQVIAWVYAHSRFEQTGEEAAYFAGQALSAFYFALRGERFARFPALPQVLSYLKLCVHTAIAQYLRDQQSAAPLDETVDVAETPDLGMRADAAELWEHICRLLPDARDRHLARCVFVHDLKPRQIVAAYPRQWRDEREVTIATYRIRQTLRRDPDLRRRAGLEEG